MNILNILTSRYHVERDTCTVHGRKKHQNAVFLVDIDLAITKGLKFSQKRTHAIIF